MNPEPLSRRFAALCHAMAPLIPYLESPTVVEIMLNADGKVWIDEAAKGMYQTPVHMMPEDAERMIRLIAASMHTTINEQNPSLAAKLPGWGARVQASVPPIVQAPTFSLRKPASIIFTLEDYVREGMMTAAQAELLRHAVLKRQNILIGGGTGSGKTTLANALLHVVAQTHDRLYLVEDNPELQCAAENKLQILVQPPQYTFQRAIMDALRYRPDRIIVGEVRDGSALDLLKAWNTGHPGGLATIHANNPTAMLDRLCQLIEEVIPHAPRELVAEAVDVCVHIEREATRGRRISGIASVLKYEGAWHLEELAPRKEEA
jgi:type IV secretion system protein VirB11